MDMPVLNRMRQSRSLPRNSGSRQGQLRVHIKGTDTDGNLVDFSVDLLEGTIVENGHCRFVFTE